MSSSFTISRDQIINLALRKLGVIDIGNTPDAETIADAALNLNLMIKQMSTEGLKLWKVQEIVMPVTANVTTYQLGAGGVNVYDSFDTTFTTPITDKPLKLLQAWYRNTSSAPTVIDTPLTLFSKQEYNMLGSKTSTGVANSVFYDYKTTYGTLYVYLTPDSYSQTNLNLHLVVQMPLQDISQAQAIPDFPNEWMNCLVWNLADQLAIQYSVPQNHRVEIAQRAAMYKEQLTAWDVESYSTFFQPDLRFGVLNK
jgi:hypothetical protein